MPKLNTTIDKIELNSNKLINAAKPLSSWTDTQYPSAKTLYNAYNASFNLAHPVGSIMITSTSTNPGDSIGGTWELVDKAFKNNYITLSSAYWSKPANAALCSEIINASHVMLSDHTISLRLNIKPTVALSDTEVFLGKLALPSCGITALKHAMLYDVAISEGGNCTVCYRLDTDGTVTVWDVLNVSGAHTMASGSSFYIHVTQPVHHTDMLDDFCDKFYWKRTA
jgi:hypothetical protein